MQTGVLAAFLLRFSSHFPWPEWKVKFLQNMQRSWATKQMKCSISYQRSNSLLLPLTSPWIISCNAVKHFHINSPLVTIFHQHTSMDSCLFQNWRCSNATARWYILQGRFVTDQLFTYFSLNSSLCPRRCNLRGFVPLDAVGMRQDFIQNHCNFWNSIFTIIVSMQKSIRLKESPYDAAFRKT